MTYDELVARAEARLFIVDATDSADVARIAELTAGWPLVTGGDSLPSAMRCRVAAALSSRKLTCFTRSDMPSSPNCGGCISHMFGCAGPVRFRTIPTTL